MQTPRDYSLDHIRNCFWNKIGSDGIYMFGGTGDEGSYSATNPPLSSDIWNGWAKAIGTVTLKAVMFTVV